MPFFDKCYINQSPQSLVLNLGISKKLGARGPLWARPGPMGFSPVQAREAQARPEPVKGRAGPGRGLHFRSGQARWAGQNHGLLGPPKNPPRGPPKSPLKGPPRSPFRSPLRGPPKGPSKSPFIGPLKSPSKSPLKSPPKSPTPPCRFFI